MKIALVLGSGSARGYAHIGVIEELKARGHEIVAISGTSMGAIIGGLEAAGGLEDFTEWACSLSQFDVLRNLDFSLRRGGVVRAKRIVERLDEFCGGARIEDLPIPFTAVATDITARREVWFQRGPLVQAMRASMSVPGFITPVMLGDHLLVDGAVLNPVPVEPTLSVPADLTIAVALHGPAEELSARLIADADEVESDAETEGPERGEEDEWEELDGEEAVEALGHRFASRLAAFFSRSGAEGEAEEEDAEAAEEETKGAVARELPRSAADLLVHPEGATSLSGVMEEALSTMEDRLERLRSAMFPVPLRIEVPEDVCRSLDFHRAEEVIEAGRALAVEAFDRTGL